MSRFHVRNSDKAREQFQEKRVAVFRPELRKKEIEQFRNSKKDEMALA